MFNIAIVDDDDDYIQIINEYLEKYGKENQKKFNISTFNDGEDIIQDYHKVFDIILMDIEMDQVDGISAAKEIRKSDNDVTIIFITNMPQYAIKGYKVKAFDFIIKPLFYSSVSQLLDQVFERIEKQEKTYYPITFKGGIQKLDLSTVKYIEVQNHDSIFHTIDGEVKVKDSLKNIEASIKCKSFFRCHKWFLVNLNYVDKIINYNVHLGTDVIQVSRSRKKELLDSLNNYINEFNR